MKKTILLSVLLMVGARVYSSEKPNILFIMSDDHTWQATGLYGGRLAALNPTPTIDALAQEGMVMENAFCQNAICTPSRASIMTGQGSAVNGCETLDRSLPKKRQYLALEMKKAGTIDKVMNIVNHEKKRLGRVDEDRVYVTGISMGGFGCYNIVSRYPKVFAAAAPVCGHGNSWPDKSKVAHIPFWAFHGAKDKLVKLTDAQKTVDALKAAGASIQFTVYPNAGHNSWSATYSNPKVYEWILAQKRKPPPTPASRRRSLQERPPPGTD